MIYVTRTFVNDDKPHHEIMIHTSCCKRIFIVREDAPGKYWDFENQEYCLEGTACSIKRQLKFQTENEQIKN